MTDVLAATQQKWLDSEYRARAAFALVRLDNLDRLAAGLTEADRFDAAYAIWDDYIDGRRADERGEPLTVSDMREQSMVLDRVGEYLPEVELLTLATKAWGEAVFEAFLRTVDGDIVGKLGYYRGASLNIRHVGAPGQPGIDMVVTAAREVSRFATAPDFPVVLHPAFALRNA